MSLPIPGPSKGTSPTPPSEEIKGGTSAPAASFPIKAPSPASTFSSSSSFSVPNELPREAPSSVPYFRQSPPAPGPLATRAFVEDGRIEVKLFKNTDTGGLEFRVIDDFGHEQVKGSLFHTADGKTIYTGIFDKPVRNFFQASGTQLPDSFILPGQSPSDLHMPDDHIISELWKFFGEKFGPNKTYNPRTFYVAGAEHLKRFVASVERFFGESIPENKRWQAFGEFSKMMGDYREIPVEGIPLKDGGRLFATHVATAKGQTASLRYTPSYETVPMAPKGGLPKGVTLQMDIVGLAAPGSAQARPTHKLFTVLGSDGRPITVSLDLPRAVYSDISTFAISHHHADHLDPSLLLKQLRHNTAKGVQTTLLMSPDVQATVLSQLAETLGYQASSSQTPLQFLREQGLELEVLSSKKIGSSTLTMQPGYPGAHGPAQAGLSVTQEVGGTQKLLYFDPSDGDFDIESLDKQIAEARKAGNTKQTTKLERSRELLVRAKVVDVDQGTTGFDTHGTDKTVRNLRRARLEAAFPETVKMPQGRLDLLLDLADAGNWNGMEAYLKGMVENESTRQAIMENLRSVRPTHNRGYGITAHLPQVREGQRVQITPNGKMSVDQPKLKAEFKKAGLTLLTPEQAQTAEHAVVHFEGETYYVSRGTRDNFEMGIRRLLKKYTVTGKEMGKDVIHCDIETMTINGAPVTDTPLWAKEKFEPPSTQVSANSSESVFDFARGEEIDLKSLKGKRAVLENGNAFIQRQERYGSFLTVNEGSLIVRRADGSLHTVTQRSGPFLLGEGDVIEGSGGGRRVHIIDSQARERAARRGPARPQVPGSPERPTRPLGGRAVVSPQEKPATMTARAVTGENVIPAAELSGEMYSREATPRARLNTSPNLERPRPLDGKVGSGVMLGTIGVTAVLVHKDIISPAEGAWLDSVGTGVMIYANPEAGPEMLLIGPVMGIGNILAREGSDIVGKATGVETLQEGGMGQLLLGLGGGVALAAGATAVWKAPIVAASGKIYTAMVASEVVMPALVVGAAGTLGYIAGDTLVKKVERTYGKNMHGYTVADAGAEIIGEYVEGAKSVIAKVKNTRTRIFPSF